MFPLKDDIPARLFPVVNIFLIGANVVCFLYQATLGPAFEPFIVQYGFIPARFVEAHNLHALSLASFFPVFSSMFLHGGLLHVAANMWMLWIFGDNVEDRMGHGRYLVFYLACGVGAVFAQFWASPASRVPMIGASGAIAGVLGAYFLLYPKARVLTLIPIFIFFYLVEIPAFFFIGFWFVIQFLQGAIQHAAGLGGQGGVAWWAHIGGFSAGVLLLQFFKRGPGKRKGQVLL